MRSYERRERGREGERERKGEGLYKSEAGERENAKREGVFATVKNERRIDGRTEK